MKNIYRISKIAALTAIIFFASSCDSFLEDEIISPNDPLDVTPQLLLTNIEVATFQSYGSQLARQSMVFSHQLSGTVLGSQSLEIANYVITEITNENEWEVIWAGAVIDSKELIDRAGTENPYFAGMAKVILALNIGLATDLWGAVPFEEAGLGRDVGLEPQYIPQEQVLEKLQTLLDDAIVDLSQPAENNVIFVGSEDLIFNGNVEQWKDIAWVLKARYANRLSEINPQESAQRVLEFLQNSNISSPAGDAEMIFFGGNAINPWFSFDNSRPAYFLVSEYFVNLLEENNDPRIPFFISEDINGDYSGTPYDDPSITDASYLGDYFATPSSDLPLVTYVESKFLEAEAHFRLGATAMAAEAYNTAVIASVEKVTGSSAPQEFVEEFASEDAGTITLEKIMMQKYIAMFTQIEVYNDWRRTGIPNLDPNPNAVLPGIPLRLPTPQSERLYNSNAIVVSDPLQPVWWDVN